MLKTEIDAEIRELGKNDAQTEYPADQEFDPSLLKSVSTGDAALDDTITVQTPINFGAGTKYPKKSQEEVVIDELLLSVPRAQGYYLKLYKEIRPNELELKERIDNYEMWSDLEWELTQLIRQNTAKNPTKWGSGKYKLVIWHDKGMRGQKRPPMDFYIDANENPTIPGTVAASDPLAQLDSLSKFTETLHKLNPAQPQLAPADILKIASDSMMAGQQLTASKETANANGIQAMTALMMQMMQQSNQNMMTLIASMNQNKQQGPDALTMMLITKMLESNGDKKSALGMIKELKEAGLIPERKEQGLAGELNNMLQLKEVAEMFMGGGQSEGGGGVLDTLIKTLGPKVPEMVAGVTGTINKVVDFNKQKLAAMHGAKLPMQPNPAKELPTTTAEQSEEEKKEMMLKSFASKLHAMVVNKQYEKFDEVSKTIRFFTGGAPIFEDAIKQSTMGVTDLMNFVTDYDKEHYQTEAEKKLLEEFAVEYINHIKGSGDIFKVKCEKCGQEYNYDNKEDFETDKKDGATCEECEGNLIEA